MKKFIILILSSILILITFTLLLKYFSFIKTKPDIILIIVIYIAITSDRASDIFIVFILGYIFDIFSGSTIGLFTMLRTMTYAVTQFLNVKFFSKSIFIFVIITFIISVFDSIYLGYQFNDVNYGFFRILGSSIYMSFINSIAAFFIYPLLIRIERLYSKLETQEGAEGRYQL